MIVVANELINCHNRIQQALPRVYHFLVPEVGRHRQRLVLALGYHILEVSRRVVRHEVVDVRQEDLGHVLVERQAVLELEALVLFYLVIEYLAVPIHRRY